MAGKKKVALLSNVTVDLLVAKLRREYDFYTPQGFDTWVQEVLDPASGLYQCSPDAVLLLLDGTEARAWRDAAEASERLGLWKQALSALVDRVRDVPVFVSTIDIRENRIKALSERTFSLEHENDWYQYVQGLAEARGNVYVFDLADLIAETGRRTFYSNKMWYLSSMPYSRDGLAVLSEELRRALGSAFKARRKIIALDLDNTLWGGVIGEDGVDGIELSDHKEGQRFFDFQRQLLEMKNRGVVLAINSKNNPEDAEEALEKHPAMLLRKEDFVARKINWQNKAANIKEMEAELNLSEGGFIFIDDNPIERAQVEGECPEVLTPGFPEDTAELLGFAEEVWREHCRPLRVLDEDVNKTRMYQSEQKRKQDMQGSLDLDEYIAKLGISVDIHRMRATELDRVTQLCNKTNQFNLTTKRYTRAEIEAIAADPANRIYTVHSADKYGDNGLISVLILIDEGDQARIDTFLMSCRVMGRKLEDVIVDRVVGSCDGKRAVVGEYIPTAKNAPVRELYDRLGFSLKAEQDGRKLYALDVSGARSEVRFDAYREIRFDGGIKEETDDD